MSSVGTEPLRDVPTAKPAGLVAGAPRSIRSDDFLRTTPWSAGLLASEDDDFYSALAFPDTALDAPGTGGFFGRLLHPEGVPVGGHRPACTGPGLRIRLVARPVHVAVLGPLWLRQMGVAAYIGIRRRC